MSVASKNWLILTQDEAGAADWQRSLQAAGLPARCWPAFRVEATPPAVLADYFPVADTTESLPRARSACSAPADIYVLTSPAAVRVLGRLLADQGLHWPAGVMAGLPGQGSARVFRQCFGEQIPIIVPPPPMQDGEHLALKIIQTMNGLSQSSARFQGKICLFNRPDGRTDWIRHLREAGWVVEVHSVYRVLPVAGPPAGFAETLAAHRQAAERLHWLLGARAPVQSVAGWIAGLPAGLQDWARRQPAWLPHPRLEPLARAAGFELLQVYHDRQQLIERLQ